MELRKLHELRVQAAADFDVAKTRLKMIDDQIAAATVEKVKQLMTLQGKQSGTFRVAGEHGVTIVGEVSKDVKWDSASLMKVAAGLSWEATQKLFKIEFGVPERVYGKLKEFGLTEEQLLAIDGARTVKYGDPKIVLEVAE